MKYEVYTNRNSFLADSKSENSHEELNSFREEMNQQFTMIMSMLQQNPERIFITWKINVMSFSLLLMQEILNTRCLRRKKSSFPMGMAAYFHYRLKHLLTCLRHGRSIW
jgi:hypothetical protein